MLEEVQGSCRWSSASFVLVEQVFSGAFEEAMRWCACTVMDAGYCLVVHARLCRIQRTLPRSKCAKVQDQASSAC